ncbi:MAG: serine/threonine-protein kinase, partial [Planctomycetota bacterium]
MLRELFDDMMDVDLEAEPETSVSLSTDDFASWASTELATGLNPRDLYRDWVRERLSQLRERLTGARVGSYQVLEEIARGGMGVVFRARQESPMFTRDVAIKFMLADPHADENARMRFAAEGQGLSGLSHPFLVSILDSGIEGDLYHFSMELVDGWSLDALPEDMVLSLERKVELVRDIARALSYLHERGVVHRDIKPANIMLDRQGIPKLLDFGIAQFSADPHTRVVQAGTPHYMAPEVVDPSGRFGSIGPAADIYALGAVLYRLVCEHDVFGGEGQAASDVFRRTCEEEPKFPRRKSNALPYDLERICSQCLRKSVADRPSAEALAGDLSRYLRRRRGRVIRRTLVGVTVALVALIWSISGDGGERSAGRDSDEPAYSWLGRDVAQATSLSFEIFGSGEKAARRDADQLQSLWEESRSGRDVEKRETLELELRKFWRERTDAVRKVAASARADANAAISDAFEPTEAERLLKESSELAQVRGSNYAALDRLVQ